MTAPDDSATRAAHREQEGAAALRRASWAAPAPFFVTGLTFAALFVQIPSLKKDFGLSDGELGVFLMLPVLSGLLAMQLTGRLVGRFGSAPIARVTMVALPVSLLGVAAVDDRLGLAAVLLVFGAADGLIDISMNSHAIAVEKALGRPIMNRCHAAWSIGSAIGSVFGGLAIRADLSLGQHYLLVAVAMVAMALVTGRWLLPAAADRATTPAAKGRRRGRWRGGWTARLVLFGVTGTIVLVVSGVVGSWSGVFLHEELDASLATASLGYICYCVTEAGARLVGDRLHERHGASILVRWAGVLAVIGFTVVVLAPNPATGIAGFAVMGLGLSVLVPLIFSAVGHAEPGPGADSGTANAADALSKVSTFTYTGLLVGPMVVGWFAESFGLTETLTGTLIVMTVVLGIGLRRI